MIEQAAAWARMSGKPMGNGLHWIHVIAGEEKRADLINERDCNSKLLMVIPTCKR
jgi:hypothetical protein